MISPKILNPNSRIISHKSSNEICKLLSKQPLFWCLSHEQVLKLSCYSNLIRGKRGGVIYQSGDMCNHLYFVVYGTVKISISKESGIEKVIELVGENSFFGEAALLLKMPHQNMAQFVQDTLILKVASEGINEIFNKSQEFSIGLIDCLAYRQIKLMKSIERISIESALQRVANYLVDLSNESGDSLMSSIKLPANKSLVASFLCLAPETFSRVLKKLINLKLIKVENKEIKILDMKELIKKGM
ncbi:Crp/Fnr family transcriptional regulator [Aquitalea sp. LB_tupeE]|uniref:Crp/Fnr family transcriptional regulator n=1 Tax=Aquitalea sp. LB_tupeE TaxID=2748078 RepID=UPI0015C0FAF2|nr:Crp/Fnr family transcriptional regulator [Aquitalea sp. LB_tupeE]NWK78786.1 Crp/Fnr family transcriptional regulator [Aquitalea sp. LB_tupeE]